MWVLVIAVILFIAADIIIRFSLKKVQENREKKKRLQALEDGLKIEYGAEVKSLKRVEVEFPKARIICIDDEPVILDSFRKILVMAGYSVDTVEQGKEALGLIRKNHYDFAFVDIKMPEMDGVEVTKQVKYVRPDIDVIIITGYASVETAVETMKFGAMDYVEKPFTEDELLELTEKCLVSRNARIKRELGPRVQIAPLSDLENREFGQFSIPGGVFISDSHCWLSLNEDGTARVGMDDFAKKMIGRIDGLELPNLGRKFKKGEPLFTIRQGQRSVPFLAPVSGQINKVNKELVKNLEGLNLSTYNKNWVCMMDIDDFDSEIKDLKIGKSALAFFQEEIEDCISHLKDIVDARKREKKIAGGNGIYFGKIDTLTNKEWDNTMKRFFG